MAKVDIEAEPGLKKRFDVTAYPSLRFLSADNPEGRKYSGHLEAEDIVEFAKAMMSGDATRMAKFPEESDDDDDDDDWGDDGDNDG